MKKINKVYTDNLKLYVIVFFTIFFIPGCSVKTLGDIIKVDQDIKPILPTLNKSFNNAVSISLSNPKLSRYQLSPENLDDKHQVELIHGQGKTWMYVNNLNAKPLTFNEIVNVMNVKYSKHFDSIKEYELYKVSLQFKESFVVYTRAFRNNKNYILFNLINNCTNFTKIDGKCELSEVLEGSIEIPYDNMDNTDAEQELDDILYGVRFDNGKKDKDNYFDELNKLLRLELDEFMHFNCNSESFRFDKEIKNNQTYVYLLALYDYDESIGDKFDQDGTKSKNDIEIITNTLQLNFGITKENIHISKLNNAKEVACEIYNYAEKLNNTNKFIIYYSGHGYAPDKQADEKYVGAWLLKDYKDIDDKVSGYISNYRLEKILKDTEVKESLVLSNSCYSGTLSSSDIFTENTHTSHSFSKISTALSSSKHDRPTYVKSNNDGVSEFVTDMNHSIENLVRNKRTIIKGYDIYKEMDRNNDNYSYGFFIKGKNYSKKDFTINVK
jgi:hypothetical protein